VNKKGQGYPVGTSRKEVCRMETPATPTEVHRLAPTAGNKRGPSPPKSSAEYTQSLQPQETNFIWHTWTSNFQHNLFPRGLYCPMEYYPLGTRYVAPLLNEYGRNQIQLFAALGVKGASSLQLSYSLLESP